MSATSYASFWSRHGKSYHTHFISTMPPVASSGLLLPLFFRHSHCFQADMLYAQCSRLVRERDEARQQLADASAEGKLYTGLPAGASAAPAQAGGDRMDVDGAADAGAQAEPKTGITDSIKERMTKLAADLSKSRKKRAVPESLAKETTVASYSEKSSHPLHLANAILCLDLHPTNEDLVATGGADNNVVLFNRKTGQAVHKMKGHSKKVVRVKVHGKQDMVLSCSADRTVKVWAPSSGKCLYTFKDHKGEVTGISLHATGDYLASCSMDKTWGLYDLGTGVCRKLVLDPAVTAGYTTAGFHPDGLILGTGTQDSLVRVWDVKTQQNVVTFQGHKGGAVGCLNFSENGFYVVSAGQDGFKACCSDHQIKHSLSVPVFASFPSFLPCVLFCVQNILSSVVQFELVSSAYNI